MPELRTTDTLRVLVEDNRGEVTLWEADTPLATAVDLAHDVWTADGGDTVWSSWQLALTWSPGVQRNPHREVISQYIEANF